MDLPVEVDEYGNADVCMSLEDHYYFDIWNRGML